MIGILYLVIVLNVVLFIIEEINADLKIGKFNKYSTESNR